MLQHAKLALKFCISKPKSPYILGTLVLLGRLVEAHWLEEVLSMPLGYVSLSVNNIFNFFVCTGGSTSDRLRGVELEAMSNNECRNVYGPRLNSNSTFCAGKTGASVCDVSFHENLI